MEEKKSNKGLKIAIIVMAVVIVGLIGLFVGFFMCLSQIYLKQSCLDF